MSHDCVHLPRELQCVCRDLCPDVVSEVFSVPNGGADICNFVNKVLPVFGQLLQCVSLH